MADQCLANVKKNYKLEDEANTFKKEVLEERLKKLDENIKSSNEEIKKAKAEDVYLIKKHEASIVDDMRTISFLKEVGDSPEYQKDPSKKLRSILTNGYFDYNTNSRINLTQQLATINTMITDSFNSKMAAVNISLETRMSRDFQVHLAEAVRTGKLNSSSRFYSTLKEVIDIIKETQIIAQNLADTYKLPIDVSDILSGSRTLIDPNKFLVGTALENKAALTEFVEMIKSRAKNGAEMAEFADAHITRYIASPESGAKKAKDFLASIEWKSTDDLLAVLEKFGKGGNVLAGIENSFREISQDIATGSFFGTTPEKFIHSISKQLSMLSGKNVNSHEFVSIYRDIIDGINQPLTPMKKKVKEGIFVYRVLKSAGHVLGAIADTARPGLDAINIAVRGQGSVLEKVMAGLVTTFTDGIVKTGFRMGKGGFYAVRGLFDGHLREHLQKNVLIAENFLSLSESFMNQTQIMAQTPKGKWHRYSRVVDSLVGRLNGLDAYTMSMREASVDNAYKQIKNATRDDNIGKATREWLSQYGIDDKMINLINNPNMNTAKKLMSAGHSKEAITLASFINSQADIWSAKGSSVDIRRFTGMTSTQSDMGFLFSQMNTLYKRSNIKAGYEVFSSGKAIADAFNFRSVGGATGGTIVLVSYGALMVGNYVVAKMLYDLATTDKSIETIQSDIYGYIADGMMQQALIFPNMFLPNQMVFTDLSKLVDDPLETTKKTIIPKTNVVNSLAVLDKVINQHNAILPDFMYEMLVKENRRMQKSSLARVLENSAELYEEW